MIHYYLHTEKFGKLLLDFRPLRCFMEDLLEDPLSILEELWTEDSESSLDKTYYEYFLEIRERLSKTLEVTRQEIHKSQETQKHY